uniref:Putative reverse transcriptase n=1 Tax=Ixodes ricinus TaxID=34613 RepID=A0A147BDN4_IXORI
MVNIHQLACTLTIFSMIIPEAGLVPFSYGPTLSPPANTLIFQAVAVLDKLGRRLAELEADVAFFGICLRKNFVDPEHFKHLSSSSILWYAKKKIIKAYRNGATRRIQDIRGACDRLWLLLLGDNFKHYREYQQWSSTRRTLFDRLWNVKRRHVLDSIKDLRSRVNSSPNSWFRSVVWSEPRQSVVNPCGEALSPKTEEVLAKGPKCCLNLKPSRIDVLSSIHTVARMVNPEEKVAFIDHAISRMEKVMDGSYPKDKRNFREVNEVKMELQTKSLKLLETDKSGRFAVLPMAVFKKKTETAMDTLFSEWVGNIGKLKRNICAVLNEDELKDVAKCITSATNPTLSIKFFLKDHKPEMPLRAVINESGTWQKVVSKFLQKGLGYACLENSLSLRNSNELIDSLEIHHGRRCSVLSMDIKDLYYSLENTRLMQRVREALELNLVKFQSGSGISVESFLTILEFYLKSTVVDYEGRKYIQKEGVCIGSSVAPILAEVYLNSLDRAVHDNLQELSPGTAIVRRYVDDILICTFTESLAETIEGVIRSTAPEFKFTVEKPEDDVLQFLDLRIHVNRGLCWEYGKENSKPVLPRMSCHSKTVKAGIVKSLVRNALERSCVHHITESIERQWKRLISVGYDDSFIKRQLELFIKGRRETEEKSRNRFAVIPYYHDISHNLKACARQFGVDTVFSSDFRLSKLTPFQTGVSECKKAHREKPVSCETGVVYERPLDCGFKYVGQTSRCINDRLNEHKRNVKNNAQNSEIAKHIHECNNCTALWSETEIIHKERNDVKRVARESVRIKSLGNCISQASLQFGSNSKDFLKI